MLIIGEKLNSSIPKTLAAINAGDEEYLVSLIRSQESCGADFLDINTAICKDSELPKLRWLIDLAIKNSSCGIMLDSPSPSVIIEAVKAGIDRPIIINSITLTERVDELLPVIKETGAGVVCLPIDKEGIPKTAEARTQNAVRLVNKLIEFGIEPQKIFIDVLVEAVSVGSENALVSLRTISMIKSMLPQVNTICGLSNVSFGLPKRVGINSAFLAAATAAGLDSAIMDITSPQMREMLFSSLAVTGQDDYCMNYISYTRENK